VGLGQLKLSSPSIACIRLRQKRNMVKQQYSSCNGKRQRPVTAKSTGTEQSKQQQMMEERHHHAYALFHHHIKLYI
jgi:hypothetical protein